jgi:hypothetical protein
MLRRATEATGALGLALLLAGCSEPAAPKAFVLWELADVYAGGVIRPGQPTHSTERQIEGGLDRLTCEVLQTKRQAAHEAGQQALLAHDRDMVRAGLTPSTRDWTSAVYRCLPTGLAPKDAPAS